MISQNQQISLILQIIILALVIYLLVTHKPCPENMAPVLSPGRILQYQSYTAPPPVSLKEPDYYQNYHEIPMGLQSSLPEDVNLGVDTIQYQSFFDHQN